MTVGNPGDDDMPQLSLGALSALKEFYGERDNRLKQFEELKAAAEDEYDGQKQLSMEAFSEDWNASQFWYSDETATTLAQELLKDADENTWIAVVSAPSVFIQLKNLLSSGKYTAKPQIRLLEFDERFSVFSEFVHYDFQHPIKLPAELKGKFGRIICDPPFLSDDCQTKAALTVRWLSKTWESVQEHADGLRMIMCTGERMEMLIRKLYSKIDIHTTNYEIKHAKGLSNEFRCYSNFTSENWNWQDK